MSPDSKYVRYEKFMVQKLNAHKIVSDAYEVRLALYFIAQSCIAEFAGFEF